MKHRHSYAATIILIFLLTGLFACKKTETAGKADDSALRNGDIVFQISSSSQSMAIQIATKSRYSHMGIVFINGTGTYVYEALQPVRVTALEDWIANGQGGHYVVKRLKEHSQLLTPEVLGSLRSAGERFMGRDYDLYFQWDDDRIYCSELVWKIYKEGAGIELAPLKSLADFDLEHPAVKQKLKERFGDNIPLDEKVISPANIFDSELLYTVLEKN